MIWSAILGDVISFDDMFDVVIAFAPELQVVLQHAVPVQLLTDNRSMFEVISKCSGTSEKRMMLDVAVAGEIFREWLTSDIGFVRNSNKVANGLAKVMRQALILNVVTAGEM